MTVEEAKAIVLAIFPRAWVHKIVNMNNIFACVTPFGHRISALASSEPEAWIDAAERIQREEQP